MQTYRAECSYPDIFLRTNLIELLVDKTKEVNYLVCSQLVHAETCVGSLGGHRDCVPNWH